MIHFSERIALTFGYHAFLSDNPSVADDPLSFLAFLQNKNLLDESAIKKYVHEELKVIKTISEGGADNANINKISE